MSEINADAWVSSGHRPMGFPEFVVVIASIMALNPLAMDMMLPALPNIASAFHIADANRPQMVLSTFLIGFGVGQFVMGPLSDRFGRRPVLLGGMTVYCIASLLAIAAPSFETLLLARALQGLGTSATRVIATSIVRDCYAGRRMASVMSLAMMVFIAVPVMAPSFGQAVLLLTQWRGIFIVLMLYGVVALIWSALRMPETLPVSRRRSLAIRDVLRRLPPDRDQPPDAGLCARRRRRAGLAVRLRVHLAAGVHRDLQARALFSDCVRRDRHRHRDRRLPQLPLRRPARHARDLARRIGRSTLPWPAIMLAAAKLQMLPLPLFMALSALMMFSFGLMISNFTALAMEPQGHIAGTASSLYGSITTLLGIGIGIKIGQDYDGTLLPFATGFFLCTLASLAVVLVVEKGRLFKPHHIAV